jgi:hypothetical protein
MLNRVWRFVVFPAAFAAGIVLAMWLASSEVKAQGALLADFNADGCVDGQDLIFLGLRYNCCGPCTDTPGTRCGPCADPPEPTDPCADSLIGCLAPAGCPCDAAGDSCYAATYDIGPLDPDTSESAPDGKIDLLDLDVLRGEFGQQDPGCP